MSNEDENACGKVGCYYYVEDYKCSNDHVSKSELRAWCAMMMPFSVEGNQLSEAARGSANILNLFLEKFCKGEE